MEYKCIKCGEEWGTEYKKLENICPFCDMPTHQAITDMYLAGGIEEVNEYVANVIKNIKYDK